MKNSIFFIVGPTGIGKSEFGINLSKFINGQIVNADSMQIYKELSILSARPNLEDQNTIKHHLYGYINGNHRYNVEKWCNDAKKIINLSVENFFSPIFIGGTGLYIDTFLNGIISIPNIPEYIKKEANQLFNNIGLDSFYNIVKKLDYESIKNISKNDTQRLKRIWEVYKFTDKKFSDWKKNKNKKFINKNNCKIILFLPDREKNYERVNNRVLSMIDNGAIQEVEKLLKLQYDEDMPIMRAHGVPEIIMYLKKKITLDECIEKIQLVTRHYVKRQHTWWKSSNLHIFKKINEFPDKIDLKSTNLGLF